MRAIVRTVSYRKVWQFRQTKNERLVVNLLKYCLDLWKTGDSDNELRVTQEEIIIPISYSTHKRGLTAATLENLLRAMAIHMACPGSKLIHATCEYTFPGAAKTESFIKNDLFSVGGIVANHAGTMNNSVQEARIIALYLAANNISHARILLVTGEMHSRSARLIWEKVFPKSKILIFCTPYLYEHEPNHPVYVQRGPWKWFAANVARHILLLTLGLDRVGKWHHRSTG